MKIPDADETRHERMRALIKAGWPIRHDYYSIRVTLRSLIKTLKSERKG